jgi:hypothetical protein
MYCSDIDFLEQVQIQIIDRGQLAPKLKYFVHTSICRPLDIAGQLDASIKMVSVIQRARKLRAVSNPMISVP